MSSEKLNYLSIGETIDGTTFCSGVETLADNIIESTEEDSSVVYPYKDGWASVRSTGYRVTTDNAEMVLPFPIYKIKSVKLKLSSIGGEVDLKPIALFRNEEGEYIGDELDITDFIVSSTEWNALTIAERDNNAYYPYALGIYKDNTFYWDKGSNVIPLLGTVYKLGSLFTSDQTPTYERVYRSALWKIGAGLKYTDPDGWNDPAFPTLRELMENNSIMDVNDVRDWQFRVEYIPIGSKTKIRARKNEKQYAEYLQPYNQRAEVNSASALGKSMWLEAQKTGTREITVVKNYTKLADIPPVGARVNHNGKRYVITANSYSLNNTVYVRVTHTLSENWTNKSKHVSVNQKYRNYSIPQDILWRNMYWEDYVTFTGEDLDSPNDASINGLNIIGFFDESSVWNEYETVDTFAWMFDSPLAEQKGYDGIVIPASTYGMANSMIFTASFKDNFSAGFRVIENSGGTPTLCEEVSYCDTMGKIDVATVLFSDGVSTEPGETAAARRQYPAIVNNNNTPAYEVFEKNFYVDKDPGEAIKFTYQVHVIGEGDCVIGSKFAEHHHLVKRYNKGENVENICICFLSDYIREGEDKVNPGSISLKLAHTDTDSQWRLDEIDNRGHYKLSLKADIKQNLSSCKAWAITDESGNLYVGRNENKEGFVHIYTSHKRL